MNNGLLPALIYEMYAASRLRGGILFVSSGACLADDFIDFLVACVIQMVI